MVYQVIFLWGVLVTEFIEVFVKKLFGDFSLSNVLFFDGFSIRSGFGCHFADTSSKEVLCPKGNDGSVVDCIDLLSNQHHAHPLCHSHGYVVDQQGYFF